MSYPNKRTRLDTPSWRGERPRQRQGTRSTRTEPSVSPSLPSRYFFVYSFYLYGRRYFLSRAGSPAFSLLSKCVESDYAMYTKRDVEVGKTACRSLGNIGYLISATLRVCRIILVISRLIRELRILGGNQLR